MPRTPLTTVQRKLVNDVPCAWIDDGSDQLLVGLLFRVGFADETLRTCGLSHIVEHLALPSGVAGGPAFNGQVDSITTLLWARGDPAEACEFIAEATERVSNIPRSRIERERKILTAEAETRSWNHWSGSLSLRYGPVRHGLIAYPELGVRAASDDEIAAWARSCFTRGNAFVYLTGKPRKQLHLRLRPGRRRRPPPPAPISYVEYPASYGLGPAGTVALSIVCERSYEMLAALRIGVLRLQQQLRHQEGTSYGVGWRYEPLGWRGAHALIWADCLPGNVLRTRNRMLGILEELALTGPTEHELVLDREEARRSWTDALNIPSYLFYFAANHLLGEAVEAPPRQLRAMERVTPGGAGRALRKAMHTMLLIVPPPTPAPGGRFTEYPVSPPRLPRGRSFAPRVAEEGDDRKLVVGKDGVALRGESWAQAAVFYDECVGAQRWPDGTRALWGRDGFYVHVAPEEWERGDAAVRSIDKLVPADAWIDVRTIEDTLPRAARAAIDADDKDEQIRTLQREVAKHPDNGDAWGYLARACLIRGRFAQAVAAAERACAIDPLDSWAHTLLARAFLALQRLPEAVQAAKEAVRINPGGLSALSDAAWVLSDADEDDLALAYAERSLELHPGAGESWFARAHVLNGLDRLDEAESDYRRALELEPDEAPWHNNLGWLFIRRERYRDALPSLERAVELDPNHENSAWNLALVAGLTGDLARARRIRRDLGLKILDATSDDEAARPDDPDPRRRRAYALCWLGRHEEALAAARSALALQPRAAASLAAVAWTAAAAGQLEEARRNVEALVAGGGDGDHEPYLTAANIGTIVSAPELVARAARVVEEKGPYIADDRLAQGYEAAALARWKTARRRFSQTLEHTPRSCCAQTWLGIALAQLGDKDAARAAHERAEALSTCACAGRHLLSTLVPARLSLRRRRR